MRGLWLLGCWAGMLAAAGCGPQNVQYTADQAEEMKLLEVGEVLREYQLFKNSPPKAIKDLMKASGSSPGGYEAVRSGDVVVHWDAALPDTNERPGVNPSDKVLAYVKRVPKEGGPVLMLDRTVRRMSAEEFQAAPKAGTSAAK
ncbi:hypothetical protein ACYOEI_01965 [Singulisphaera rosea]